MIVIDCVWLIRVSSYRRYSLTLEKLGMLCAYDIVTSFILLLNSSLYLYKFIIIVDFTDSNSAYFIKQGRMRTTSWENLPCTIYPAKLFSFVEMHWPNYPCMQADLTGLNLFLLQKMSVLMIYPIFNVPLLTIEWHI